jgi:hypothetical protein
LRLPLDPPPAELLLVPVPEVVPEEVVPDVVPPDVVVATGRGLLISVTVPPCSSRTKTLDEPLKLLLLSLVRLVAWESNAMKRPFPEIQGLWLSASASVPEVPPVPVDTGTDAMVVVLLCRSNTKMFERPELEVVELPDTRLPAVDSNAMKRPSLLIVGCVLSPSGEAPLWPAVTRVMALLIRSTTKMLD